MMVTFDEQLINGVIADRICKTYFSRTIYIIVDSGLELSFGRSNEEFGQFSCLTVSLAARLAVGSSSLIAAAAQALTNFLLWSIIAFTNKLDTDKVPVADKSSFAADKSSFSTVPPNSAKEKVTDCKGIRIAKLFAHLCELAQKLNVLSVAD
ncbi:hypothetical protein LguiA_007484 [Lonicera macranthoides]